MLLRPALRGACRAARVRPKTSVDGRGWAMPEMTRYEHGVPSWVDIGTQDLSAGVRFYSELFGWDGQDMGEEAGHYRIVTKDGQRVAAISPAQDPGPPHGAQLVNEPGTFTWSELSSSDVAKSKAFYSAVFGWGWAGGDNYPEAQVSGRTIGGLMPRRPGTPADVPDNWLVYFGATDVDADLKKATDLGASVIAGPADIPGTGRFAVLTDPQGAAFALFQG